MKPIIVRVFLACLIAAPAFADVVILRDGSSYSGRLSGEKILFTGADGVGFTFPIHDVQSVVFTPSADTITLTSGKTYSGHYMGAKELDFTGPEGVAYRFPVSDLASLVLTARAHQAGQEHAANLQHNDTKSGQGKAKVIPEGTQITITTNERIDSRSAKAGQLFAATIGSNVLDSEGAVAIPTGTAAELVVRHFNSGGAVSTPELVLDLYSLDVGGQHYRMVTTNVVEHGRDSIGANRRTLAFTAGGSGLGALLGGVFGGGRGAGVGALAGAGSGALTQLFTRGEKVIVPVEATLTFRLERTLVLRPTSEHR